MLTEGSKANLQEVFAGPRKEKCRLAGAGSLDPKEKACGGLPGPALSLATRLAPAPTSSGPLHGVTLGVSPPHPVHSSLGLQMQQMAVPWEAQHPPSDGPPCPGPPHPKDAGQGTPWPSEGSAEPLGQQPGPPLAGQRVGAGTDPRPGNEQGGQVSSTVNQGCESWD